MKLERGSTRGRQHACRHYIAAETAILFPETLGGRLPAVELAAGGPAARHPLPPEAPGLPDESRSPGGVPESAAGGLAATVRPFAASHGAGIACAVYVGIANGSFLVSGFGNSFHRSDVAKLCCYINGIACAVCIGIANGAFLVSPRLNLCQGRYQPQSCGSFGWSCQRKGL